MRVLKKVGILSAVILLSACLLLSLCGCFARIREDGYFTYYIKKDNDGVSYVCISQLTELGKQQKVLVIPETIDGKEVRDITKQKIDMWDAGLYWESESLEKVFFSTSKIGIDSSTFRNCANLEKIVVINYDIAIHSGQYWVDNAARKAGKKLCISKKLFDTLYRNKDVWYEMQPANVTYYNNYETDINYGTYWIDDVEYGEKIEYIPTVPIRDGYDFDGWYKETECIKKWNFETDTLPEEQIDEEGNVIYQETMLYAKWIKK